MYRKENKDSIRQLFDGISRNYDLLNFVMSFGMQSFIKKKAVSRLPRVTGGKILDLCCGTGEITRYLASCNPASQIVGCDFSANMLNIALEKSKDYTNISYLQMDVTKLLFEDETFDECFIGFGLRNLPNIKDELGEIKRVLKADGILSILDLGKINGFLSLFYNIYFYKMIPFFGKIINKKEAPYQYLVKSLSSYPSQSEMLQLLLSAGYKESENKNFLFGAIAQQTAKKVIE